MADDKKKPAPASTGTGLFHKDHYKESLWVVPLLIFISILLERLLSFVRYLGFYNFEDVWGRLVAKVMAVWPLWQAIALSLTLACIGWGVHSFRKLREIEAGDKKIFGELEEDLLFAPGGDEESNHKQVERWQKVVENANSDNESNWRLAIIEADIMLEDLLKSLGYQGEGVGEMLKSVEPTDMLTLDNAWEAHKVRNRIAHSGTDFQLNARETKRVISLFESVFKEFKFI